MPPSRQFLHYQNRMSSRPTAAHGGRAGVLAAVGRTRVSLKALRALYCVGIVAALLASAQVDPKTGPASAEVALGDFDGDGSLDVFLACGEPRTGTPNEVWLNDGKGHFRDSGVRLGNVFSSGVALGDLNGDGRLDAFVVNLRLVDGAKNPPVFGGVPAEVWLNTSPARPSSLR